MNPAQEQRIRPPRRAIDGVLLLDKAVGISSNHALQAVRRLFGAAKAGHTGTLDPLASGLLPVCFGEATKFSGELLDADKRYLATVQLGITTDTADAEGRILERRRVSVTLPEVEAVLAGFLGESEQVPPMYSALKRDGKPLYEYARAGVEVERKPRRIVIHRFDLVATAPGTLDFEVACSKGTYVRTLAEDLARACGTVGHVQSLRRLALGPFTAPAMHSLEAVERAASEPGELQAMLLPADAALPALPPVQLGVAEQACILQGQPVFAAGPEAALVRMYGADGLFLGVGRMSAEGRRLAPERIMVRLAE